MKKYLNEMQEYDKRMGLPDFNWSPEIEVEHYKKTQALELKYLNLPDVEPMIIKQTMADDYFNKPQNRVDRRKKARSKLKKKNR